MLCNDFKHEFPLIHVSRRLSSRVALDPCYVDIVHEGALNTSESEKKSRQMTDQYSNSALTRFDQSFGGHVFVGNYDDVDGDVCLPLRFVFPISFDCLDSQMVGG